MKVYIISLGCPKNLTDTEVLMGKLVASGHAITSDPSQAETIIVNTCAFLKSARHEAIKTIQEMAKWKKKGKCKKLYIAGCLPKWMLGNRPDLSGQVSELIDGEIDTIGLFNCRMPRIKATPSWYAYVKIAEGCNNCCSYCTVPMIRGRLHTRKISDILEEVKALAKRGVKEIIYVAQDTTAHPDFATLLRKTARIPGIKWIRVMYAHPLHATDKLIEVIASEKKIVKYLDLPIQHACDKILAKMRRRYTRRHLEKLISKIRRRNLALRSSVIVGFPGEGEAEFQELLDFIKRVKFEKLGVFTYSKEEGTPAAKMGGQVSEKEKTERFKKLMRLQGRISKELNKKLIGKTLEVVMEGARQGTQQLLGRSYMDAPEIDGRVFVDCRKSLKPGERVRVRITDARTYDLIGCIT